MISQVLDEIRARLDRVSPGDWERSGAAVVYDTRVVVATGGRRVTEQNIADAEFLANAKADIVFLLDLVERLQAQIAVKNTPSK